MSFLIPFLGENIRTLLEAIGWICVPWLASQIYRLYMAYYREGGNHD